MQYDAAYEKLQSLQKHSTIARDILHRIKPDGSNKIAVLQAINTYTYGGHLKNTHGNINKKAYAASRIDTKKAEDKLRPESVNTDAETFFARETTHSPQDLSKLLQ